MISLFYRAWEKYRFPVTYRLGDEDRFTHHLLDLIGLGTPGLQDRQAVPDDALLHYVALLGEQSRSASALEAILRDYFEVPVEIEQFTGAWYRLDQILSAACKKTAGVAATWRRRGCRRRDLGPAIKGANQAGPDGA